MMTAYDIHRRRNLPVSTAVDELLPTDTYLPRVGDRHALAPKDMYPFDAVVVGVRGDKATVTQAHPGEDSRSYGVEMPLESVAHFVNDLRAYTTNRVYGTPSSDPVINAVIRGDADFLGKGDDGIVFRVDTPKGQLAVKVSTTVPYQPLNQNHLTPVEAAARLKAQHDASEAMAAAGIPGILPSSFDMHGEKGFMVKPYVKITKSLTREQLDEVAASVEAAHRAGWVFRDDFQVGLWNGRVYHFDTGKAEYVGVGKKSDPEDYWSEAYRDVQNLKRFFGRRGGRYLTEREKHNPIAEFEALNSVDERHLTPEQRYQYRNLVFRLSTRIKEYLKNHPDEDNGFWSEMPGRAADEIRIMMEKFKEPTPK